MRELTAEETTQYLERIIKTEMSLRNLKEVKGKVDNRISYLENELSRIQSRPSKDRIREPRYLPPREPVRPSIPEKHKVKLENHATLFGMAADFMATSSANSSDMKTYENDMTKYRTDMEKYRNDKATYEIEYKKEMQEYRNRVQSADIEDDQKKKENPVAIKKEQDASHKILVRIKETEDVLEKLYNLDVIFPKYREIVALCSMYEYFVTGRVSELKGPNGAYNLFESELRQNIIIDELKQIANKLEQIKQNQYTLYSELKKSNEYLAKIGTTLTTTLESVNRIADAVEFNNMLTANISDNVEAIKYISLIK
jgi:hypothetical protein